VAASLLRQVDSELAALLDKITYASTATINLAYRRADIPHPLDGFGFVVPFIEHCSILACTFSSIKFEGRAPADHVLLRAFVGGALQPEIFELDESEIISRVRADFRDLLGIETAPLFTVTEKWRKSMPQYHVGHLELVAQIQDRLRMLPALTLTGNSYSGAGIPDCIRSGEAAADEIINSFPSTPVG
jgi:oxygen-dependent protoporphyrinogen oxidase